MSSIKPYKRLCVSRGYFMVLKLNNIGNYKWVSLVEVADNFVLNCIRDGRNSCYPLQNHITRHLQAHNEFIWENQSITYAVPDEHNPVRWLLQSITSNSGTVIVSKSKILANNTNHIEFEQVYDFLILTAPAPPPSSRNNNVRGLKKGGGKSKRRDDNFE